MNVYTVATQKGGVGKTTTAIQLANAFALNGSRTLIIDLDAQANTTLSTVGTMNGALSIFNVLSADDKTTLASAIVPLKDNLSVVPSSIKLSTIARHLPELSKHTQLKKELATVAGQFDVVIIDAPPALSELTINALVASNFVIVPVEAGDLYSVQAIYDLADTIADVQAELNPSLSAKGILITKDESRPSVNNEIESMLPEAANYMHTTVFNAHIRKCSKLKEANGMHQSIFEYAPKSNAACDYKKLFEEITSKRI